MKFSSLFSSKSFVIAAATVFLVGCATPHTASTPSGAPEVDIAAPIEKVRPAVLNFALNKSYEVETETPSSITFSKGRTWKDSVFYGERQKRDVLVFTLIQDTSKTRLVAKQYVDMGSNCFLGMCSARDKKSWLPMASAEIYDSLSLDLKAIKAQVESGK